MNYKSYITGLSLLLMVTACDDDDKNFGQLVVDMSYDRTEVSAGEMVKFMDRSLGNPTRWDWTFEGGTPATSQLFSPEVSYNVPGTYSVTLRVARGDNSNERVFTELIHVAYPGEITADFEADKVNAYNTDDITFTDKSVGFPSQWEWIFTTADGIRVTSSEQNPVLKFAPGVYTVTLNVSSPAANATITKENYLNVIDHDAVIADFRLPTSLMILAGESVTFEDMTMGRPVNWSWNFEGADASSSTERNPTVRYSTPGRYTVTLTASNEINSSVCKKEGYVMVLPTNGLAAWFPFNGSLSDMGPNRNVVMEEYVSDPSKWRVNVMAPSRHENDYSVQTGGVCKTNTDDYAVLQITNPDRLPGGLQQMTMVMWFKSSAADGSRQGLFNRGRPAGAITGSTADKNQSQEWARLNSTSSKSEGFARWYVHTTGQGSASAVNTADKSLLDDQWHFIAYVKEISENKLVAKIYVDGNLAASAPAQTAKDTYKDPFFIGCTEQFTAKKEHQINTPFMGCLDDILFYERALTAAEIASLYDIMK